MTDVRSNRYKNLNIELMRMVLTIAICLHHFRLYSDALPYGGGYLATDCFFLISGFFLYRGISKYEDKGKIWSSVKKYIISRISRLFPQYLLAVLVGFIAYRFFVPRHLNGGVVENICEVLMLPFMNADVSDRIIPPDWYVGYLLLGSIIVFLLLIVMHDSYRRYVIIIASLMSGYGLIAASLGNLCIYPGNRGIFSPLTMCRVLLGICSGVLMGIVFEKCGHFLDMIISRKYFRLPMLVILALMEIYFLFWYKGWTYLDFVAVLIFMMLFVVFGNRELVFHNTIVYRSVCWISKICYTVYLNHYLIAYIFLHYNVGRQFDWKVISLLYLGTVFCFSVIMYYAYTILHRLIQKVII